MVMEHTRMSNGDHSEEPKVFVIHDSEPYFQSLKHALIERHTPFEVSDLCCLNDMRIRPSSWSQRPHNCA